MVQFQVETLDGSIYLGSSLTLKDVEGYVTFGDLLAGQVANVTILKPAAEPLPPPGPPPPDLPLAGGSDGVPGDPGSTQGG